MKKLILLLLSLVIALALVLPAFALTEKGCKSDPLFSTNRGVIKYFSRVHEDPGRISLIAALFVTKQLSFTGHDTYDPATIFTSNLSVTNLRDSSHSQFRQMYGWDTGDEEIAVG